MRKTRVYIDTSVIGGCFDKEFEEWSNKLFEKFISGEMIAVISDITIEELENAPKKVKNILESIPDHNTILIAINKDAYDLANQYIKFNVISEKYLEDAQHIAISTVSNVDVLVSWNFKHIVNLERIRNYNSVNLKYGYNLVEIRTPRELVNE